MNKKPDILVVDDEQASAAAIARTLRREYDVTVAFDGHSALELLNKTEFSIILSDQRMPGLSGIDFFKKSITIQKDAVRILITGYSDLEAVVEAVNSGKIYYYISKPWEPEELRMIVRQGVEKYRLVKENRELLKKLEEVNRQLQSENVLLHQELEKQFQFTNIVGDSAPMRKLFELMNKIIPSRISVLISGETGTGKELVARAIHYNSPRRNKPFVAENCAALSDTLLESRLFGHRKGAFTGAVKDQKGLFELADGGTVFLDEIGDTSADFQKRLLRVLQEGEFSPLGSESTLKTDVRIIAATNKNLKDEIGAGRFREDLYFRLNVMPLHLPALRERIEDIRLLVRFFIEKYSRQSGYTISGITSKAMQRLNSYNYPGNVRELENIIQRAVMLTSDNQQITENSLILDDEKKKPVEIPDEYSEVNEKLILRNEVSIVEKNMIIRSLKQENGNISIVARKLGISRVGLYKKIDRYGIKKENYRS